jgi:ssDNA-binding Zn-finger/Zn-ribbon topoisomerase 1
MSILDLGHAIFGDLDNQVAWFQQKNLLSLQPMANCPACGTAMVIQTRNDTQDKRS